MPRSIGMRLTSRHHRTIPTVPAPRDWCHSTVPRLRGEAEALIATHWSAVERVASALRGRRLLTGEEVKALVG